MTTETRAATAAQTTTEETTLLDEILADVVAAGKDTSALSRDDRSALLVGLSRRLGLNPLSGAVMFLRTNGRETLYVTKQGTDQIAARERLRRETIKGPELVVMEGKKVILCQVRATHPDGRSEVSTATLALADIVNDMMKCETKAKRRATLSICGLGLLAEDEIETIPGAQTVAFEVPKPAPAKSPRDIATEAFAADLDEAETVRDVRICYLSLVEGLRAAGVAAEDMAPALTDGAAQIRGALGEFAMHLSSAELSALFATDGEALARGLDSLLTVVLCDTYDADMIARWWVNVRTDLSRDVGAACYRVAQRALATDPADASAVRKAGDALKRAIARLDQPPPTGTDGPSASSQTVATGDAANATTPAAPVALAALPDWTRSAAAIIEHVATEYLHPAAVLSGARKWGLLLGAPYLTACADRLAALDPSMADHARGVVERAAVEGPKTRQRKAA